MTVLKPDYGTNNQGITITLASLANSSSRQSTSVDNTTNLYDDALVSLDAKTASASVSATGTLTVYAYGTVDGGTNYTDGATGTDSAFTPTNPTNLKPLGIINANAVSTTYHGGPWSVAQAFGGVLPASWGIVVSNNTGAALDATEINHTKNYQGIQYQFV